MDSARSTRALPRVGFPIRRSRDQRLVSTSPALIAAAHVLHRLLAPRHPPCALILLIEKNTLCVAMEFSRCTRTRIRPEKNRPIGQAVSQNSAAIVCVEVDIVLGEPVYRTNPERGSSTGRQHLRSKSSGIPRKEVIQPQLPL